MAADSRARSPFDVPAYARSIAVYAPAGPRAAVGRLAPVLVVLALAQLLDLVTFAFAVEKWGIQGELGPLGLVYEAAGYWAVATVKTVTIALVMLAMVSVRWQNAATPWRVGIIAAAIGAFGAATNVAALL